MPSNNKLKLKIMKINLDLLIFIILILNTVNIFPLPQFFILFSFFVIFLKIIVKNKIRLSLLILIYTLYLIVQLLSFWGLNISSNVKSFFSYYFVSFCSYLLIIIILNINVKNINLQRSMVLASNIISITTIYNTYMLIKRGVDIIKIIMYRLVESYIGATNYIAIILGIILPYGVSLLFSDKVLDKILSILSIILSAIVIVLTLSRNGIIVFLMSLILSIFLESRYNLKNKKILVKIFLIILILSIIFILFINMPLLYENFLIRWKNLGTLSGREIIWRESIYTFQHSNKILGIGLGQLVGETYPSFPHNIFLQILVWNGILGLLIFMAIMLVFLLKALIVIKYINFVDNKIRLVLIASMVSVFVGIISSFFEITINSPFFDIYFWSSMAIFEKYSLYIKINKRS
jgi:O-antigen ligase